MEVLESGHLSRYGSLDDLSFGHKVYSLEQEFAALCGSRHAVATSSGTGSILISLLALGIGPGDEVLVPGFTYVASIGAIVHARATPVLVEVDESLTMDPADVRAKITERTRAIMPVHMLGNPCDMTALRQIADQYGLSLVEDCAQAGGATFRGKRVGTFGEYGAFSLNRYKMMAAGDGGIIVTDDQDLYERAFALHDQGHTPLRDGMKEAGPRSLIGLNFKMNELTGAVALAQTRKLDWMLETLREKKAQLKAQLPVVDGMRFRTINDLEGECATLLTVLFDTREQAERVAGNIGGRTVGSSGWHIYHRMDQIVEHKTPGADWSQPARHRNAGDLPRTDDILSRAVNLSVGVVDSGIGAGFGINFGSTSAEIAEVAGRFAEAVRTA
jgi:dTDP-4-amino-4,6-dideoxygalactose transaminase